MLGSKLFLVLSVLLASQACCSSATYSKPYCDPQLNSELYNVDGESCVLNASLCECRKGCGPPVLSIPNVCVDCSKHRNLWILSLLLQLLLLTLLYVACVLLKVQVASCPLNAVVFFYQIVTLVVGPYDIPFILGQADLRVLVTIYGFFNLDFFRYVLPPLCVSHSLKHVHGLYFEYIIALYPLLLTGILFFLIKLHDKDVKVIVAAWRPFQKCFKKGKWNPKTTIVNTFATFLLLSHSKLLSTSLKFFFPAIGSDNETVFFYDPSIRYFDGTHSIHIVLASLLVIIVFVLPPVLLLLLYPTKIFNKCLECCKFHRFDLLSNFMDIFQGWYKDGTNDTRDFRSVSALYLLMRVTVLFISLLTTVLYVNTVLTFATATMYAVLGLGFLHVLVGIFHFVARPYKKLWMNNSDGVVSTLLGTLLVTSTTQLQASNSQGLRITVWMASLPLIYGAFYGIYHSCMYAKKRKVKKQFVDYVKQKVNSIVSRHHKDYRRNSVIASRSTMFGEEADRFVRPEVYEESQMNRIHSSVQAAEGGGEDSDIDTLSQPLHMLHADSCTVNYGAVV